MNIMASLLLAVSAALSAWQGMALFLEGQAPPAILLLALGAVPLANHAVARQTRIATLGASALSLVTAGVVAAYCAGISLHLAALHALSAAAMLYALASFVRASSPDHQPRPDRGFVAHSLLSALMLLSIAAASILEFAEPDVIILLQYFVAGLCAVTVICLAIVHTFTIPVMTSLMWAIFYSIIFILHAPFTYAL
ncbi:hypothetical protein [Pseudodesulfovibrio alkaliphilus]|nr:hypothetical protein [Pseudodesulfovibrio alkaliphilus]